MNILYINHYAGSLDMGMEFRPYYLAKEWIRMGHAVMIVAGDYSHLRSHNPQVTADFQIQNIEGIEYCWLKTGQYSGNGVKRAFSMGRFVSKLWLHSKKLIKMFRPDVIIASSTYPLDTYAAKRIARKSGAKLVHEIHDMWPATLIEIGAMSKHHPFVVANSWAEKSFCKHADHIVSMLPGVTEYLAGKGADPEKITHIPNGIVLDDWFNPEKIPTQHAELLDKLCAEKRLIVGYFGGHALSNDLDQILDVAKACADLKVAFVLVGEGVEKPRLRQRAREMQLSDVYFLPGIPKKAIPDLIAHFDTVLITGKDSALYRFGVSMNKIFDTMMAGKPIIMMMNIEPDLIDFIGMSEIIPSGRIDLARQAVVKMMELPADQRKQISEESRQIAIERHSYERLAARFEEILQ